MIKKQIILTTILVLLIPVAGAQQSRFPIKAGSVWRINYEFSCSDVEFIRSNGDEEYKYFIEGDTIAGGKTYFKLYKTGVLYLDSPFAIIHKYMGAIRDSADRIYYLAEDENSEKLLYDFTVDVGDSVYVEETGMKYPVERITTVSGGRKQFVLEIFTVHCGSANTIIEGIGWLGGLLEGNSCSGHPGVRGSYLVCYSEDDEIVYQGEQTRCGNQVPCEDIVVSAANNELIPVKPEVVVLPGGSLIISLEDDNNGIYDIRIFNTWGQLNYHTKSDLPGTIDASTLGSGFYLLKLGNKEKSYITKFVVR